MHRQLKSLFDALGTEQVEWSLLRIPRNADLPPGDVDFLVAPEDLPAFDRAARDVGFTGLPGWGKAPSLLYVAFDPVAARFLLLDVTDRVSFAGGTIPTDFAAGVLARRLRDGATVLPSPDDEFWLLLLHCLLDKRVVPPHYRARLTAAARDARLDTEIPRAEDVRSGGTINAAALRRAVVNAEWEELAALAGKLARAWGRSVPRSDQLRLGWTRLVRAAARPRLLPRRRGLSVALLGPNGAGKSTLAEGIADAFPLTVTRIYMGLWKVDDSDYSAPRLLLAAAARPFRAWARLLRAQGHQALGRLVVFDRYPYDARRPTAGAARLPQSPAEAAKRAYMWVLSRACPPPDLTLLLNLPGAVAYARKGENGLAETEAEASDFLSLRGELPLHVIDASLDADAVRGQALALIWRECQRRWAGDGPSLEDAPGETAMVTG